MYSFICTNYTYMMVLCIVINKKRVQNGPKNIKQWYTSKQAATISTICVYLYMLYIYLYCMYNMYVSMYKVTYNRKTRIYFCSFFSAFLVFCFIFIFGYCQRYCLVLGYFSNIPTTYYCTLHRLSVQSVRNIKSTFTSAYSICIVNFFLCLIYASVFVCMYAYMYE